MTRITSLFCSANFANVSARCSSTCHVVFDVQYWLAAKELPALPVTIPPHDRDSPFEKELVSRLKLVFARRHGKKLEIVGVQFPASSRIQSLPVNVLTCAPGGTPANRSLPGSLPMHPAATLDARTHTTTRPMSRDPNGPGGSMENPLYGETSTARAHLRPRYVLVKHPVLGCAGPVVGVYPVLDVGRRPRTIERMARVARCGPSTHPHSPRHVERSTSRSRPISTRPPGAVLAGILGCRPVPDPACAPRRAEAGTRSAEDRARAGRLPDSDRKRRRSSCGYESR